jgi:hypothetical protein
MTSQSPLPSLFHLLRQIFACVSVVPVCVIGTHADETDVTSIHKFESLFKSQYDDNGMTRNRIYTNIKIAEGISPVWSFLDKFVNQSTVNLFILFCFVIF